MSETTRSTSETSTTRGADDERRSPPREPRMIPQWGLEVVRWVFHPASRLLWKLSFRGIEHIPEPEAGGLLIAANHQTYIDPFWISIPIRRPTRYLAWDEALKWPLLGKILEFFGAWPLQLKGGDPTAIRRSLQWLRGGGAVLIFPEGARARGDGEMGRFKPGAARIALEANVPILPVTIRGAHRVWPRGGRMPRPGRVEIIYHPLYTVALGAGEDVRACAERVSRDLSAIIGATLKEPRR